MAYRFKVGDRVRLSKSCSRIAFFSDEAFQTAKKITGTVVTCDWGCYNIDFGKPFEGFGHTCGGKLPGRTGWCLSNDEIELAVPLESDEI